jgi:hypothetical protein
LSSLFILFTVVHLEAALGVAQGINVIGEVLIRIEGEGVTYTGRGCRH